MHSLGQQGKSLLCLRQLDDAQFDAVLTGRIGGLFAGVVSTPERKCIGAPE